MDKPKARATPSGFRLLTGLAAAALVTHRLAARRFHRQARALAARLGRCRSAMAEPVHGVPLIIRSFARRAAPEGPVPAIIRMRQRAAMRLAPNGPWRPVTAEQLVSVYRSDFVWTARMQLAPGVSADILDAYVGGNGVLEVRPFGSLPLVRASGPEIGRGELTRYLAELASAPQAMLYNPELCWRAIDQTAVEVSSASPAGPVRLRLMCEGGDIVAWEADERPRSVRGGTTPTRWQGRCCGYQTLGGYRIPTRSIARWILPEGPFDYWRGEIIGLSTT